METAGTVQYFQTLCDH